MKPFKGFQIARAFSSAGDEMWASMLPIFLASIGFDAATVGLVFSSGAIGGLLGFLVIPALCERLKSSFIALLSDVCQLGIFSSLVVVILADPQTITIQGWAVIQFVIMFLESIWFGSSETLITRISNHETAQSAHKWNYFSGSLGPAVGPALAGIIYQIGGMVFLAGINAVSFSGQALSLFFLRSAESFAPSPTRRSAVLLLLKGIKKVWSDPRLRYLTAMPVVVKVYIIGAIPFVGYKLSLAQLAPFEIGLLLGGFAIGNLIGALTYRACIPYLLPARYARDAGILLLSGLLLNGLVFYLANPLLLALTCFISGIFIARYSIELRSLRQSIVPSAQMATVVSSQGFLARLATPLAGLMFGYLLSKPVGLVHFLALLIFVSIGSFGIFATRSAFERREGC